MNDATKQIIVCLMAAHFIGDFFLQSTRIVTQKNKPLVLFEHTALLAALSYLLCGLWLRWEIPAAIFATHSAIDFVKVKSGKNGPYPFLIDQTSHIIVIVVLSILVATFIDPPVYWVRLLGAPYLKTLIVLTGALASVKMGGFLIGLAVRPLELQMLEHRRSAGLEFEHTGFEKGGMIIGQLERGLIFLLILIGQPAGIGFLIAAKSILRLGEAQDPRHRKEAEYIIIGTLMSFGWGIGVAYLTMVALQQM